MLTVALVSLLLVALTTAIHYEVLSLLSLRLGPGRATGRGRLLVIIFSLFLAHMVEIALYGVVTYELAGMGFGSFTVPGYETLVNCLILSAETYTSLGFGEVTPTGDLRLMSGIETLNGLLLIGWSASFLYISMEKYWRKQEKW